MTQAVGITAVCSASATTSAYCYVPYGGERRKVYIWYDCFACLRFKSFTESFHRAEGRMIYTKSYKTVTGHFEQNGHQCCLLFESSVSHVIYICSSSCFYSNSTIQPINSNYFASISSNFLAPRKHLLLCNYDHFSAEIFSIQVALPSNKKQKNNHL